MKMLAELIRPRYVIVIGSSADNRWGATARKLTGAQIEAYHRDGFL